MHESSDWGKFEYRKRVLPEGVGGAGRARRGPSVIQNFKIRVSVSKQAMFVDGGC